MQEAVGGKSKRSKSKGKRQEEEGGKRRRMSR
jgi:hypothetical protein